MHTCRKDTLLYPDVWVRILLDSLLRMLGFMGKCQPGMEGGVLRGAHDLCVQRRTWKSCGDFVGDGLKGNYLFDFRLLRS